MSLLLYYGSGSPYAWRAHLALEHKALAHERKILSFSEGDTKKPEFIALNPSAATTLLTRSSMRALSVIEIRPAPAAGS